MNRNVWATLVTLVALAVPCLAQNSSIITVAGGANPYFLSGAGDGGPATSAALGIPANDVGVDNLGNLYISAGGLIREVTAKTGAISTIAGGGTGMGDSIPATQAALSPTAIAIDGNGNLFIADTAYGIYRIREISGGVISTVAGGAACCALGDGGPALNAYLAVPYGVAVDGGGNIYIAQASTTTNSIRKVSAGGTITTLATGLVHPTGVAVDGSGNVYFADSGANLVGRISGNVVVTVAGNGSNTNSGDGGQATQAGIHAPWHVTLDGLGNMYITQLADGLVRWVASGRNINTISDGGLLPDPAGLTASHGVVYVANEAAIPTAVSLTPQSVPILSITKSHTGNFTPGQTGAAYSLVVTNVGAAATSGAVTVTDTLPAGLTLSALTGTGWNCTLGSTSCTQSNPLGAGSSYPAITVTVTVSPTAPASVTNQASVSGGGSASANASDLTNINQPVTNAFFSTQVSVGSGLFYMAFPDGNLFGYFGFLLGSASTQNGWFYHIDMGYEYFIAGNPGSEYLFDLASTHWWYTSSSLFPYLYDFTLNSWIYYFPNTASPGHYTTNPRYFSNLTTGKILTM